MNVLLILTFALFGAVHADISDALKKEFFNVYKNVAVTTRDIKYDPVTADKVTYYLFKKENPNEFVRLDPQKLDRVVDENAKIVFLIHGWTNSREEQWYEDVKNAFLNRNETWHVVQVDWKEPASAVYTVASISTYDVGNHIANLIVDLNKNYGVPLDDLLLVGHSLGGQICGFISKRIKKETGQTIPRIIALDPAGPLFTTRPEDKRLNKNDAKVVHVVHSNGGTFGYHDSIGTIDFFPNGGSSQPGCKQIDLFDPSSISDPVFCDHRRAWKYFAEAVLNPGTFIAKKCESWSKFKRDKCDNVTVSMGDVTTTETGDFYLETNKEPPYAKKSAQSGFGILKLFQH
ncbi:phospholipase A1 isoform X1 [Aethina tumida]|uniref:phospholipase A1 isoform X1 n=1 Tax=Aethina tumida TaxID=116153 RepID=UPI002148765A|nr:phospholipase A1 isoform X1 [Aethina tumida]